MSNEAGSCPELSTPTTPTLMRTIMLVAVMAVIAATVAPLPADARTTGFDPRIVTFGDAREDIKSTPITERPYRPMHVYGNTVRRRHQRAADSTPARSVQR